MSTLPFAHLHCHSHYSLLDGAGTIRGLLERAKALRMNALALTDHGNLHGAVKFYQTAKELGINPILGLEAYIAPGSRFHKESAGSSKEANYHLTLLARNAHGLSNLVKLSSAAFLEGFYFKPRIDKELLAAHREGLICLSGCVSSELSRTLLAGGEANLEKALRNRRLVPRTVRRRLLHRDPEQPSGVAAGGDGGGGRGGPAAGHPAGGHQRRPLRPPRGRRGPGHPAVRQHRQVPHRHQPDADGEQRVLPPQRRGDVRGVSRPGRRPAPQPGDRRQRRHRAGAWASGTSPSSRLPEGKTSEQYLRELVPGGAEGAIRRSTATAIGATANLSGRGDGPAGARVGRDQQAGLRQLLPDRLGLRALRPRAGHSGHGPRLGRAARWFPTRCT